MLIYQIVLAILFGILRGCKEGLVMIQPYDYHFNADNIYPQCIAGKGNVRNHDWFGIYHLIGFAKMTVYTALIYFVLADPNWFAIVGLLFLIWESYELAYSVTRYNTLLPKSELITFVDVIKWRIDRQELTALHIIRVTAALGFLVGGSVL